MNLLAMLTDAANDDARRAGADEPLTALLLSANGADCEMLPLILKEFNWRLELLSDPCDLLPALKDRSVAVVICDQNVPGGWLDVLDRIATLTNPPKVLVLTSEPDSLWSEAVRAGAYDVISRPLDAGRIFATVCLAWYTWAYEWRHNVGRKPSGRSHSRQKVLAAAC